MPGARTRDRGRAAAPRRARVRAAAGAGLARAGRRPTRAATTSRSGATPRARPGGRRPPCTCTTTSSTRRSWWGGGSSASGPDDLVFSASKLHFAFGLGNSLYFPARVGAASVLVPERLEAERDLRADRGRAAHRAVRGAHHVRRLLQVDGAERRFDLSSLRLCVSSGEALPAAIFHAWKSRFGHELLDVVGSTEALHDFIANRPGEARPGSSGRVIPGFEARLVDDEGRPVAPGFVGQLLIKGDSTARRTTGTATSAPGPPCSASGCAPATCSTRTPTATSTSAAAATTC